MRKIFSLTLAIFMVFISSTAFAGEKKSTEELKLYKSIIISKDKIETDFGAIYNTKITKFFENLRTTKNKTKVEELDKRLSKAVKNFSNKNFLTAEEAKIYNLVLNLYFRNKLLKDYQLANISASTSTSTVINSSTNNNSTTINNSTVSEIISKTNWASSTTSITNNISFSYSLLKDWTENKSNSQIVLTNKDKTESINILTSEYGNYSNFANFRDAYKTELLKNWNIRNFFEKQSYLDWKTAYVFSYDILNWETKQVYLVDFNGMVVVVTTSQKYNSISSDIVKIIDSFKITK